MRFLKSNNGNIFIDIEFNELVKMVVVTCDYMNYISVDLSCYNLKKLECNYKCRLEIDSKFHYLVFDGHEFCYKIHDDNLNLYLLMFRRDDLDKIKEKYRL